jgi:uncharacterized protein YpuA (DUF1002 family)
LWDGVNTLGQSAKKKKIKKNKENKKNGAVAQATQVGSVSASRSKIKTSKPDGGGKVFGEGKQKEGTRKKTREGQYLRQQWYRKW